MIPGRSARIQGSRHAGKARLGLASCLAAAVAAGGCATAGARARDTEVFGHSVERRPIAGAILGDGRETCLLIGVVHGNEGAGAPLLEQLIVHVESNPEIAAGKRLVIVPVLNPDGLARGTRGNSRGVDLNRNLPASNWTPDRKHGAWPGSEAETRVLLKIIRQFRPARILAVHAPLHCVNYDGPAVELARGMARAAGYPLRASIGYETPGSLGSYSGVELGIPTITFELPRTAPGQDLWPGLRPALEAFIRHPGDGTELSQRAPDRRAAGQQSGS
jgi:murein peptide amidase A